jgi:hypothetical protein
VQTKAIESQEIFQIDRHWVLGMFGLSLDHREATE